MKKLIYIILIAFILLLALNCEGPQGVQGPAGEDGDYDKQITLIFPTYGGYGTEDESGNILNQYSHILKFNKNNYVNVDSIIFTALISSNVPNNYCFAELYNLTDSVPIDSSLVMTNNTTAEWLETGNIINYLPDYDITLAVRFRTEHQGSLVYLSSPRLYLFRN